MKRIYVVEDEAVVALEIMDRLRTLGYEVVGHAVRADAALREIPELEPDLVLLDIHLGGDISGLDVAERLRDGFDVPTIFLTAHSEPRLWARAAQIGSFAYLVKPFNEDVLAANIELALVRHDAARQLHEREVRFRALFEQAAVAVAEVCATTHRFLRVNHKCAQMLGYSVDEMHSVDLARLAHPHHLASYVVQCQKVARGEISDFELEMSWSRRDRAEVWTTVVVSPLRAQDGSLTSHIVMAVDITSRKRLEELAARSEEQLHEAQQLADVGSWRVDLASETVEWSPHLCAMLGRSPDHVMSDGPLGACVHPDDRAEVLARVADATRNATSFEIRHRVVGADGMQRHMYTKGIAVTDEHGQVVELRGTSQDVTILHLHTAVLHTLSMRLSRYAGRAFSEELVEQLLRVTRVDAVFIGTYEHGTETTFNCRAFVADGMLCPVTTQPVVGTPHATVLAGDMVAIAKGAQQQFPADPFLAALHADGYLAVPVVDAQGAITGGVGLLTRTPMGGIGRLVSILELFAFRMSAEVEREQAELRFAAILEAVPDGVLIVERDGRISFANREIASLLGYDHGELLTLSVEDLVPPAERHNHTVLRERFSRQNRSRRMASDRSRLDAYCKDGRLCPVEIALAPLPGDRDGRVVAVVRDLTIRLQHERARMQLDLELRQVRKMEALGTLAGGIAHDFNNLLTVIGNSIALATATVGPHDPVRPYLDTVAVASRRAESIVKQVLTFSRRQPSDLLVVSVGAIVEEVAHLLTVAVPPGVRVIVQIDGTGPAAPTALVDVGQIHQVLMNLGTNAWAAMATADGSITFGVDVCAVEAGDLPCVGMSPGRYVRVQVVDSGVGIEPDVLERIFDPFFTTKPIGQGTGLGLSVVHGIVTDHGGSITVHSAPGAGSTFTVYLPQVASGTGPPPPARRSAGACRVLVIDDDEAVLNVTLALLRAGGFDARGFTVAADGVATFRREPNVVDVVLTDQHMPHAGGLDVAREVSAIRPEVPIVLMSGNQLFSDDELAAVNIRHVLGKPFTAETLTRVLEQATSTS